VENVWSAKAPGILENAVPGRAWLREHESRGQKKQEGERYPLFCASKVIAAGDECGGSRSHPAELIVRESLSAKAFFPGFTDYSEPSGALLHPNRRERRIPNYGKL
jgi:hypothetical protein